MSNEEKSPLDLERIKALCASPWPLASVLERLIGAVDHLLHDHDCDQLGWEGKQAARDAAAQWFEPSKDVPALVAEVERLREELAEVYEHARIAGEADSQSCNRVMELHAELERLREERDRLAVALSDANRQLGERTFERDDALRLGRACAWLLSDVENVLIASASASVASDAQDAAEAWFARFPKEG